MGDDAPCALIGEAGIDSFEQAGALAQPVELRGGDEHACGPFCVMTIGCPVSATRCSQSAACALKLLTGTMSSEMRTARMDGLGPNIDR